MKSLFLGRISTIATAVRYAGVHSSQAIAVTSSNVAAQQPMSASGVVKNFYVQLSSGPGAGTSYNFILQKNGIDTAMSITISDAATTASDTTNSVSYVAGDTLQIQITPTNTPGTPSGAWSLENISIGQIIPSGDTGNVTSNVDPSYAGISGSDWNATSTDLDGIIPTAGTIDSLYTLVTSVPGASRSRSVVLVKNGVDTALTATISGASQTSASDTTHSVSVVPGDLVYFRTDPSGTPTSSRLHMTVRFNPSINGESIQLCSSIAAPSNTAARFFQWTTSGLASTTAESSRQNYIGNSYVFRKLYASVSAAPTAGKSWTFNVRSGGADTNLACVISNSATTSNNTSNNVIATAPGALSLETTPSGTPTSTTIKSSFVMFSPDRTVSPARSVSAARLHGGYVSIGGVTGNRITTPDSVANQLVDGADIKVYLRMTAWDPGATRTVVCQDQGTSPRGWALRLTAGARPNWFTSNDGTTVTSVSSSSAAAIPPFNDGSWGWIRANWRSSDGLLQFWWSEQGSAWTKIGADRTGATTTIFNSTQDISIGSTSGGGAGLSGDIGYVEIRSSFDGTIVGTFNAQYVNGGTMTDAQGNVWTLRNTATLVKPSRTISSSRTAV